MPKQNSLGNREKTWPKFYFSGRNSFDFRGFWDLHCNISDIIDKELFCKYVFFLVALALLSWIKMHMLGLKMWNLRLTQKLHLLLTFICTTV